MIPRAGRLEFTASNLILLIFDMLLRQEGVRVFHYKRQGEFLAHPAILLPRVQ